MARRPLPAGSESLRGGMPSKSSKTKKAESQSRQRWVDALSFLLRHADQRFGDVAWATNAQGTEDVIWAHKALLYARSSAGVLHRYLQGYRSPVQPHSSSNSSLANLASSWPEDDRLTPSLRSISPDPSLMSTATIRKPMQLEVTDRALLDPLLQYIYTGQGQIDAFAFLFEEAQLQQSLLQDPHIRLSQDLLFMWRSKLYADVLIQLVPVHTSGATDQTREPDETQGEVFATHRAILATVPYFESLLLGSYDDRDHRILTLPSPPLTPASLHFVLGYLYCGTLDFSQRTFDLTTAFAIYNSAQYLGIDALRLEVECRIEDMCFGARPDPLRCARLFQWSLMPDVNCPMLQQRSKGVVLDRFSEAWRIEVGSLAQDVQQRLVTEKCLSMTPDTAIDALRGGMTIRSKLETITQSWASHVLAMLEPVEARAAKLLVLDTTAVVTSASFVDLIEGRTFSGDVLERALTVLSANLEERTAALAYQAVVGHVLLREQGIQVDARVLVEDCRQAILKYLKARWVGTKAAAGFNDLDSWALKEVADELDMKPQELIAVDEPPPPPLPPTRTGLRPVRRSAASQDSDPSLRASLLNRNAASTMTKNSGRILPKTPGAAARSVQTPRSRPLRPANNLTPSSPEATGSSVRTRSTATSDASTRKPRMSQSTAASDTTAETSADYLEASPGSNADAREPERKPHRPITSASIRSGRRSAEPSSHTTARSSSAVRRPMPSSSARVRTISQDGASARTSVRSTAASLARERATAAAREKAAAPPMPPTRPPRAPSAASSTRPSTSKPSSVRPTAISTTSTASSVRTAATARSHTRKDRATASTPTPTTPTTPKLSASRPGSVNSHAPTARSISSRSLAPSERVPSTKSSAAASVTSRRSASSTNTASPSSVRDRKTSVKSTSSSMVSVQHGRVAKRPAFGTSLNVGIRCVVSFADGQKSTGSVLYLGPVPELSTGNWVGVEVDEPEEVTASDVQWSDGQLEGVRYFTQSRKRRNMQCGVFVRPAQVMYLF